MNKSGVFTRNPSLTGHQVIGGIWFPFALFDEALRQTLILQHWQEGAKVYRFSIGDLLVLPEQKAVDCHDIDGWPLLLKENRLCSGIVEGPLPVADLILVSDGVLTPLYLKDAIQVDPADWINLHNYQVLSIYEDNSLEILSKQQVAYIENTIKLFESGNIDEALYWAIPLGGEGLSLAQSFSVLKRRRELELSRSPVSLYLNDELSNYLKTLYRDAFERLDREGKIDQAVFVLAELLVERDEALDYLERKQRHQQVVKLVLDWDFPEYRIVNLYYPAEKWNDAIMVARRDNLFADAVSQLEQIGQTEFAHRLRIEWAEFLVAKGELLQAVEVIWPLENEHERAKAWLQQAEGLGESFMAKAVVKRAILLPETLEQYQDYIVALSKHAEHYQQRMFMAEAILAEQTKTESLALLASAIVPRFIVDQVKGLSNIRQKEFHQLIKLNGNTLLKTDLPTFVTKHIPQHLSHLMSTIYGSAPQAGMRKIYDAVLAYDDYYLLALGDNGALLVNDNGKTIYHFNHPAYEIVISENRRIALFVTQQQEDVYRVTRIDIAARTHLDIGMVKMSYFARCFDGLHWTIATQDRIKVVDILQEFKVVWQVDQLPGQVCAFSSNFKEEQWGFMSAEDEPEIWSYNLPDRHFSKQIRVSTEMRWDSLLLNPGKGYILIMTCHDADGNLYIAARMSNRYYDPSWRDYDYYSVPLDFNENNNTLAIAGEFFVIGAHSEPGKFNWCFHSPSSEKKCLEVEWPANGSQIRRCDDHWLIFDEEGRVLHVSVKDSQLKAFSV